MYRNKIYKKIKVYNNTIQNTHSFVSQLLVSFGFYRDEAPNKQNEQ